MDTDVLLHHSLDKLLIYDCWLASDDVRYISTGLGFGAKKGHPLIKCMMDAYREYKYPFGTNVTRDTPIVERELPQWKKSNKSQQIDDILLIGLNDYGKYAKHLYTYTWADETTQKNRKAEIIKGKNSQLSVKILWKIKCFVRSPKIISCFDSKRGISAKKNIHSSHMICWIVAFCIILNELYINFLRNMTAKHEIINYCTDI